MTELNRQDAIWDYFQNQAPESFEGSYPRIRFLLKSIPAGARVLNIGVGSGIFEQLALQAGIDVYALDPVAKSIENLRARLNLGDKAQVGYGEAIPFDDGMFDIVVASEVLEHLSHNDMMATLAEIHRILKPGGMFKGTVPARENLSEQIVVCPDCSKAFHRWGHMQSFTTGSMQKFLASVFSSATVQEKLFVSFKTLNNVGRLVGATKLIAHKLGRHGSNQNVYFEAIR